MAYILSNSNRFYTALENSFGAIAGNYRDAPHSRRETGRPAAVGTPNRRDKTGSRTFPGVPAGGRLSTKFQLQTYLTSWQKTNPGPAYGPLFQSALGGRAGAISGRYGGFSDRWREYRIQRPRTAWF